jgi:F-type H+-transporting ATPase subunit a
MLNFINSPLEQFEFHTLFGIVTPFVDLSWASLTNFGLYSIIIFALFYYGLNLIYSENKLVGSNWSIVQEAIYDTILNINLSQIGKNKESGAFFPFFYSLFVLILFSNLTSMIPYSFALNAHIIFVLGLSWIVWFGVTITGFYHHGLKFFGLFVPTGTPTVLVPVLVLIELLSYTARAFSLGLRLGANIIAGHLLLAILANLIFTLISISYITFILGVIPFIGIFLIVCLEFGIASLQAYVFTILAAGYLKDGLFLH